MKNTLVRDFGLVVTSFSLLLGSYLLYAGLDNDGYGTSAYLIAGATLFTVSLTAAGWAVRQHVVIDDLERYARGAYQRDCVSGHVREDRRAARASISRVDKPRVSTRL
jgi:hypothetical protein